MQGVQRNRPSQSVDGYQIIETIGSGTYGTVYKVQNISTKDIYALKVMKVVNEEEGISPVLIREISILRDLSHPNIVKLKTVSMDYSEVKLYFEYLDYDLKKFMDKFEIIDAEVIKCILYQLLCGLNYLHLNRIIHRDIKPQVSLPSSPHPNILINKRHEIKITDFGLARSFAYPLRQYTRDVVTWWYRAPEIFMGCLTYTSAIDIWSLGCVFAQLVNGFPLFPGDCDISTLFMIFQKLGTPDEQSWPGISQLDDYSPLYPKFPKQSIAKHVPSLDKQGVDLLDKMMQLYPEDRISAAEALKHPYFDSVRCRYRDEEFIPYGNLV